MTSLSVLVPVYNEQHLVVASLEWSAAVAGFRVSRMIRCNRIGRLAWWLNGKVLRKRSVGLLQSILLKLMPQVFRVVEVMLPRTALPLIAVMELQPERPHEA